MSSRWSIALGLNMVCNIGILFWIKFLILFLEFLRVLTRVMYSSLMSFFYIICNTVVISIDVICIGTICIGTICIVTISIVTICIATICIATICIVTICIATICIVVG